MTIKNNNLLESLKDVSEFAIKKSFLEQRKIFLWGPVTDESCQKLVEQLLFLESQDDKKEIKFFINSPGGVVTSGMTVFDTIKMIKAPVYTICMGMAASMGSLLLSAGEKGNRYIFPNGRVMIHQPSIGGEIVATATDLNIHAEEILKTKDKLNKILAEACNQPLKKIEKDTDRDYFMDAEESIEYGIVDKISDKI